MLGPSSATRINNEARSGYFWDILQKAAEAFNAAVAGVNVNDKKSPTQNAIAGFKKTGGDHIVQLVFIPYRRVMPVCSAWMLELSLAIGLATFAMSDAPLINARSPQRKNAETRVIKLVIHHSLAFRDRRREIVRKALQDLIARVCATPVPDGVYRTVMHACGP